MGTPRAAHRDASMDALCQPARGKTGGVRMRSNGNWHEGRRPADLSRPWAWGGQSCLEVGCLLWVRGGGGRATDATDPPPTHTHTPGRPLFGRRANESACMAWDRLSLQQWQLLDKILGMADGG